MHEDDLIGIEILESCDPPEEPGAVPIGIDVTSSEMKILMENIIRISAEVATTRSLTVIVEETIEDVLTVGYE